MNDEGAGVRSTGRDARIAVVGGDEALTDAVEAAGTVVDLAAPVDAVVAVGETALAEAAGVDAPILAVDAGGPPSVPRTAAADLVPALAAGRVETVVHPLLRVECGRRRATALFDVTLVTAEPARISEFSVHSGGRAVDRFRADGVVVATPLGSHGYADAAGGPTLALETDALVAVPISPFAIDADRWVLPSREATLRVEREESPVECYADADLVGTVAPDDPVTVRPDGVVRFVRSEGE